MINPRIYQLTDYPFARLRTLLEDYPYQGDLDMLNMSIGEPQMQPPAFVSEVIVQNGHLWNKYPPMAGTQELREAIAKFLDYRYGLQGLKFDPYTQIIPVNGTREGLFMLGSLCIDQSLLHEKPLVLIPDPFYQVYLGTTLMHGAQPYFCPATKENGFQPDFTLLPEHILKQVQMAFICSPSNPQGASVSKESLCKHLELAKKYNFTLVVDECYSEIYYTENPPIGGLEAAKEIDGAFCDHLLIVNSLSKRSSAAGLRSGFVAGSKKNIQALLQLRNYGGAVLPTPIQAASAALWSDDDHVKTIRAAYAQNMEVAKDCLKEWPDINIPDGGFFLWLPVQNAEKAAQILWQQQHLRTLPGTYLSRNRQGYKNPGENYLRLALVHEASQIYEGLTRLCYHKDQL